MRGKLQSSGTGVLGALAVLLCGTTVDAETRSIKQFGDWSVYSHSEGDQRLCFAMTPPRASDPEMTTGLKPFLYVSAWPREGVRAEVSAKTSVTLKPGAPASIIVDRAVFRSFVRGDRAYVADATDELKLLDAMKKGSTVVVVVQTEQGAVAKDTYSLKGIADALQAVTAACR